MITIRIKNKTAQAGIGHFFIDKTFIKTFLNKNSMDTAGLTLEQISAFVISR